VGGERERGSIGGVSSGGEVVTWKAAGGKVAHNQVERSGNRGAIVLKDRNPVAK